MGNGLHLLMDKEIIIGQTKFAKCGYTDKICCFASDLLLCKILILKQMNFNLLNQLCKSGIHTLPLCGSISMWKLELAVST